MLDLGKVIFICDFNNIWIIKRNSNKRYILPSVLMTTKNNKTTEMLNPLNNVPNTHTLAQKR